MNDKQVADHPDVPDGCGAIEGISVPVIDLGCGPSKQPGAFGVDRVPLPNVDLVWDLTKVPYPFSDASADMILCRHTLEHFDFDQVLGILREVYRILKPGGSFKVVCPHAFSIGAMLDPTHKSFWTFRSFDRFARDHPYSYYIPTGFDFEPIRFRAHVNLWYRWDNPPRWKQLINAALSRAFGVAFHWHTLPDVLVKTLPFFRIDVDVVLAKRDPL